MGKIDGGTARAQETRRKIAAILVAAEAEFGRKGYEGTTVQSIADRAGLSKRQVIHHFGSKEAVYETVFEEIMRTWRTEEVEAEPGDPLVLFQDYMSVLIEAAQHNPVRSWFIINDMTRGGRGFLKGADDTGIGSMMEWRVRRLEDWAREGQVEDGIDPLFVFFTTWALQHFFSVFGPEIAYFFDKSSLDGEDWQRIEAESRKIVQRLLASR